MIIIEKKYWHMLKNEVTGTKSLYMTCPLCGRVGQLNHDVQKDGTVTPSVDCPTCSFHDHVQLKGWKPLT